MSDAPYTSGRWYGLYHDSDGGSNTQVPAANTIYFAPFRPRRTTTFDRIGISVSSLAAGGSAQIGVYNRHGTTFEPDTLLLDAGVVSTASTGDKPLTVSLVLVGDVLYWLAVLHNAAPAVRRPPNTSLPSQLGGGLDAGLNPSSSYSQAFTFGALPATATPALISSATPVRNGATVMLRAQ